jgi:hypothetical protein
LTLGPPPGPPPQAHDIFKQRLSPTGAKVSEAERHVVASTWKQHPSGHHAGDHHAGPHAAGPEPTPAGGHGGADHGGGANATAAGACGSCYGAEDAEHPCCNSCSEVGRRGQGARRGAARRAGASGRRPPLPPPPKVRDAYQRKGWVMLKLSKVAQCADDEYHAALRQQEGEGCRMWGHLRVNKVAGNFHFAAGRSYQQVGAAGAGGPVGAGGARRGRGMGSGRGRVGCEGGRLGGSRLCRRRPPPSQPSLPPASPTPLRPPGLCAHPRPRAVLREDPRLQPHHQPACLWAAIPRNVKSSRRRDRGGAAAGQRERGARGGGARSRGRRRGGRGGSGAARGHVPILPEGARGGGARAGGGQGRAQRPAGVPLRRPAGHLVLHQPSPPPPPPPHPAPHRTSARSCPPVYSHSPPHPPPPTPNPQVVPTVYVSAGNATTVSNQYSVTEHFRESAPAGALGAASARTLPGLFFFYDLSPIKVRAGRGLGGRTPGLLLPARRGHSPAPPPSTPGHPHPRRAGTTNHPPTGRSRSPRRAPALPTT